MTKQLPLKANLEYDKKQAKSLLKAFHNGEDDALQRVQQFLPHVHNQTIDQVRDFPLTLMQAQTVIAREYDFKSWGDLRLAIKLNNKDYGDKLDLFKSVVYQHDAKALDDLLTQQPEVCDTINDPHFAFGSTAVIISKHHMNMVEVLLKHGADINAKSQWWAGDFHVLEGVDTDLANKLIEKGATITVHSAAEQGWLDWLETAYQADPDIVNQRGGDGKAPLHYTTDPKVMDWLLERGTDINLRDIDHAGTPLQWMIAQRKWDVSRQLIERGAQVDIFAAVALGDINLAQKAIADNPNAISARVDEAGYDLVPQADGLHQYAYIFTSGVSPHQVAVQFEHDDIFDLLVEHSPIDVQLVAYCAKGNADKAKALVNQHPDLISKLSHADQLQLGNSAWNRQATAVKLMLELGFDPHIQDTEKMTPLHRAAFHGFDDIVNLLLTMDNNPPLDWLNNYGGTPLTTCLYGSNNSWRDDGDFAKTLKLLVDAGSPVKAEWLPIGNDEFDEILRQGL